MKKKSVLLVGRNHSSTDFLKMVVEELGGSACLAKNGREALQSFRQNKPDLAIVDLTMLEWDGATLLRAFQGFNPRIPVILVDDHPKINDALEAIRAGAKDFLTKPFDLQKLKNAVQKGLSSSSTHDSSPADPAVTWTDSSANSPSDSGDRLPEFHPP